MLKINRQLKNHSSILYVQNTSRSSHQKVIMKEGLFAQEFKESYGSQLQKEIGEMIEQLEITGKKFSENPSDENLYFYKKNVQAFFRFVSKHAFSVKEIFGRRVDYKLINTINQKLEDLSDQVKSREVDRMDLLAKIDEIKGLIVDLVF